MSRGIDTTSMFFPLVVQWYILITNIGSKLRIPVGKFSFVIVKIVDDTTIRKLRAAQFEIINAIYCFKSKGYP